MGEPKVVKAGDKEFANRSIEYSCPHCDSVLKASVKDGVIKSNCVEITCPVCKIPSPIALYHFRRNANTNDLIVE